VWASFPQSQEADPHTVLIMLDVPQEAMVRDPEVLRHYLETYEERGLDRLEGVLVRYRPDLLPALSQLRERSEALLELWYARDRLENGGVLGVERMAAAIRFASVRSLREQRAQARLAMEEPLEASTRDAVRDVLWDLVRTAVRERFWQAEPFGEEREALYGLMAELADGDDPYVEMLERASARPGRFILAEQERIDDTLRALGRAPGDERSGGSPLGMVPGVWNPIADRLGLRPRTIALLAGLEEVVFSGVFLGLPLVLLERFGLPLTPIIPILFVASFIAFTAAHWRHVYLLRPDGRMLGRAPSSIDRIRAMYWTAFVVRAPYLIAAMFVPLGLWIPLAVLPLPIVLHAAYNRFLAPRFHWPLGLIAGTPGRDGFYSEELLAIRRETFEEFARWLNHEDRRLFRQIILSYAAHARGDQMAAMQLLLGKAVAQEVEFSRWLTEDPAATVDGYLALYRSNPRGFYWFKLWTQDTLLDLPARLQHPLRWIAARTEALALDLAAIERLARSLPEEPLQRLAAHFVRADAPQHKDLVLDAMDKQLIRKTSAEQAGARSALLGWLLRHVMQYQEHVRYQAPWQALAQRLRPTGDDDTMAPGGGMIFSISLLLIGGLLGGWFALTGTELPLPQGAAALPGWFTALLAAAGLSMVGMVQGAPRPPSWSDGRIIEWLASLTDSERVLLLDFMTEYEPEATEQAADDGFSLAYLRLAFDHATELRLTAFERQLTEEGEDSLLPDLYSLWGKLDALDEALEAGPPVAAEPLRSLEDAPYRAFAAGLTAPEQLILQAYISRAGAHSAAAILKGEHVPFALSLVHRPSMLRQVVRQYDPEWFDEVRDRFVYEEIDASFSGAMASLKQKLHELLAELDSLERAERAISQAEHALLRQFAPAPLDVKVRLVEQLLSSRATPRLRQLLWLEGRDELLQRFIERAGEPALTAEDRTALGLMERLLGPEDEEAISAMAILHPTFVRGLRDPQEREVIDRQLSALLARLGRTPRGDAPAHHLGIGEVPHREANAVIENPRVTKSLLKAGLAWQQRGTPGGFDEDFIRENLTRSEAETMGEVMSYLRRFIHSPPGRPRWDPARLDRVLNDLSLVLVDLPHDPLVAHDPLHVVTFHPGLSRRTLYLTRQAYERLRQEPWGLAVKLAHDLFEMARWDEVWEIVGRPGTIQEFRDAHPELVAAIDLQAHRMAAYATRVRGSQEWFWLELQASPLAEQFTNVEPVTGRVFKARRVSDGRQVALRLEAAWSREEAEDLAHVRDEVQDALAGVESPYVARLLDNGQADIGVGILHYDVLEWVDGPTLEQMKDSGALRAKGLRWTLGRLQDMARGLAGLHEAGLLHADVSISNTIVSGQVRAVLIDYFDQAPEAILAANDLRHLLEAAGELLTDLDRQTWLAVETPEEMARQFTATGLFYGLRQRATAQRLAEQLHGTLIEGQRRSAQAFGLSREILEQLIEGLDRAIAAVPEHDDPSGPWLIPGRPVMDHDHPEEGIGRVRQVFADQRVRVRFFGFTGRRERTYSHWQQVMGRLRPPYEILRSVIRRHPSWRQRLLAVRIMEQDYFSPADADLATLRDAREHETRPVVRRAINRALRVLERRASDTARRLLRVPPVSGRSDAAPMLITSREQLHEPIVLASEGAVRLPAWQPWYPEQGTIGELDEWIMTLAKQFVAEAGLQDHPKAGDVVYVYRALKETLWNALIHGTKFVDDAELGVAIRWTIKPGRLVLVVEDNGRSPSTEQPSSEIVAFKERLHALKLYGEGQGVLGLSTWTDEHTGPSPLHDASGSRVGTRVEMVWRLPHRPIAGASDSEPRGIEVRPVAPEAITPEHLEGLAQVDVETFRPPSGEPWDPATERTLLANSAYFAKHFTGTDQLVVIAREHGRIVGYAAGGPLERYAQMAQTAASVVDRRLGRYDTAYLRYAVVHPLWQAQGIGARLLDAFVEEAFAQGYAHVSLIAASAKVEQHALRLGAQVVRPHSGIYLPYLRLSRQTAADLPAIAGASGEVPPLIIGVPKEIKAEERRVGLTPEGARQLSAAGVMVIVETGAGEGSGFTDAQYARAGATIARSAEEVYGRATVIKKVKELQPVEYELVHDDHVIFTFNHFEDDAQLTQQAQETRAAFVSYEKVVVNGPNPTPLLSPMSRIAGVLAVDLAQERLTSLRRRQVVILGGGAAGEAAARRASVLGARVVITEANPTRIDALRAQGFTVEAAQALEADPARKIALLRNAAVIVGTIYQRGRAPEVIDQRLLARISRGRPKVLVDVAVDQGGNFAFIERIGGRLRRSERKSSHQAPFLEDAYGNALVRIPNMPAARPREASIAITKTTLLYLLSLTQGLDRAVRERPELLGAISIIDGRVTDAKVAEAHNLTREPVPFSEEADAPLRKWPRARRVAALRAVLRQPGKTLATLTQQDMPGGVYRIYRGSVLAWVRDAGFQIAPWELSKAPPGFWQRKANRIRAVWATAARYADRKPAEALTKRDFQEEGLAAPFRHVPGQSVQRLLAEAGIPVVRPRGYPKLPRYRELNEVRLALVRQLKAGRAINAMALAHEAPALYDAMTKRFSIHLPPVGSEELQQLIRALLGGKARGLEALERYVTPKVARPSKKLARWWEFLESGRAAPEDLRYRVQWNGFVPGGLLRPDGRQRGVYVGLRYRGQRVRARATNFAPGVQGVVFWATDANEALTLPIKGFVLVREGQWLRQAEALTDATLAQVLADASRLAFAVGRVTFGPEEAAVIEAALKAAGPKERTAEHLAAATGTLPRAVERLLHSVEARVAERAGTDQDFWRIVEALRALRREDGGLIPPVAGGSPDRPSPEPGQASTEPLDGDTAFEALGADRLMLLIDPHLSARVEDGEQLFSGAQLREAIARLFTEPGGTFLPETLRRVFGRPVRAQDVRRIAVFPETYWRYQEVLRVAVHLRGGETGRFGLLVSRGDASRNDATRREFAHLWELMARSAHYVPSPYVLGETALEDGRPVVMFSVEWLEGFEELQLRAVKGDARFAVLRRNAYRMSEVGMREELLDASRSARVAEAIAHVLTVSFDEARGRAVTPVVLNAGDFVYREDPRGGLHVRLISARGFTEGLTPAQFIAQVLALEARDRLGQPVAVAPSAMAPRRVFAGIERGLIELHGWTEGRRRFRAWLTAFKEAEEGAPYRALIEERLRDTGQPDAESDPTVLDDGTTGSQRSEPHADRTGGHQWVEPEGLGPQQAGYQPPEPERLFLKAGEPLEHVWKATQQFIDRVARGSELALHDELSRARGIGEHEALQLLAEMFQEFSPMMGRLLVKRMEQGRRGTFDDVSLARAFLQATVLAQDLRNPKVSAEIMDTVAQRLTLEDMERLAHRVRSAEVLPEEGFVELAMTWLLTHGKIEPEEYHYFKSLSDDPDLPIIAGGSGEDEVPNDGIWHEVFVPVEGPDGEQHQVSAWIMRGEGPALVMIHGAEAADVFEPQVQDPDFLPGRTKIVLDRYSYEIEEEGQPYLDLETHVMASALDQLIGEEGAILLGHSFAGILMKELYRGEEPWKQSLRSKVRGLMFSSPPSAKMRFYDLLAGNTPRLAFRIGAPFFIQTGLGLLLEGINYRREHYGIVNREFQTAIDYPEWREREARDTLRVLVEEGRLLVHILYSRPDRFINAQSVERFAQDIGVNPVDVHGSRWESLGGHVPMQTRPQRFKQEVERFYQSVLEGQSPQDLPPMTGAAADARERWQQLKALLQPLPDEPDQDITARREALSDLVEHLLLRAAQDGRVGVGYHRIEHSLEFAYLITQYALRQRYGASEMLAVVAAALLHDYDPGNPNAPPAVEHTLDHLDRDEDVRSLLARLAPTPDSQQLIRLLIRATEYPITPAAFDNLLAEGGSDTVRHLMTLFALADKASTYLLLTPEQAEERVRHLAHEQGRPEEELIRGTPAFLRQELIKLPELGTILAIAPAYRERFELIRQHFDRLAARSDAGGRWPWLQWHYDAVESHTKDRMIGQAVAPSLIESGGFVTGGAFLTAVAFGLPFALSPPLAVAIAILQVGWHVLHGLRMRRWRGWPVPTLDRARLARSVSPEKLLISGLTGLLLLLSGVGLLPNILFLPDLLVWLIGPHLAVNLWPEVSRAFGTNQFKTRFFTPAYSGWPHPKAAEELSVFLGTVRGVRRLIKVDSPRNNGRTITLVTFDAPSENALEYDALLVHEHDRLVAVAVAGEWDQAGDEQRALDYGPAAEKIGDPPIVAFYEIPLESEAAHAIAEWAQRTLETEPELVQATTADQHGNFSNLLLLSPYATPHQITQLTQSFDRDPFTRFLLQEVERRHPGFSFTSGVHYLYRHGAFKSVSGHPGAIFQFGTHSIWKKWLDEPIRAYKLHEVVHYIFDQLKQKAASDPAAAAELEAIRSYLRTRRLVLEHAKDGSYRGGPVEQPDDRMFTEGLAYLLNGVIDIGTADWFDGATFSDVNFLVDHHLLPPWMRPARVSLRYAAMDPETILRETGYYQDLVLSRWRAGASDDAVIILRELVNSTDALAALAMWFEAHGAPELAARVWRGQMRQFHDVGSKGALAGVEWFGQRLPQLVWTLAGLDRHGDIGWARLAGQWAGFFAQVARDETVEALHAADAVRRGSPNRSVLERYLGAWTIDRLLRDHEYGTVPEAPQLSSQGFFDRFQISIMAAEMLGNDEEADHLRGRLSTLTAIQTKHEAEWKRMLDVKDPQTRRARADRAERDAFLNTADRLAGELSYRRLSRSRETALLRRLLGFTAAFDEDASYYSGMGAREVTAFDRFLGRFARAMRRRLTFGIEPMTLGNRVVEIGPGDGKVTERLAKAHPQTHFTIFEPDPVKSQELTHRLGGLSNVTVIGERAQDWENRATLHGRIDTILQFFPYLEQPDEPDAFAKSIAQWLRLGGQAVVVSDHGPWSPLFLQDNHWQALENYQRLLKGQGLSFSRRTRPWWTLRKQFPGFTQSEFSKFPVFTVLTARRLPIIAGGSGEEEAGPSRRRQKEAREFSADAEQLTVELVDRFLAGENSYADPALVSRARQVGLNDWLEILRAARAKQLARGLGTGRMGKQRKEPQQPRQALEPRRPTEEEEAVVTAAVSSDLFIATETGREPTRLLTRQEERRLIRLAQAGNLAARHLLITANEGLIDYIVTRAIWRVGYLRERLFDREDLVTAGVTGLLAAIDSFNMRRTSRLAAYAGTIIRSHVTEEIAHWLPITQRLWSDVAELRHLADTLGRRPTEDELMGMLGWGRDRAKSTLVLDVLREESLDRPLRITGKPRDPEDVTAESALEDVESKQMAEELVWFRAYFDRKRVPVKNQNIWLLQRIGPVTLDQAGRLYGVTRERARQLADQVNPVLNTQEVWRHLHTSVLPALQSSAQPDDLQDASEPGQPEGYHTRDGEGHLVPGPWDGALLVESHPSFFERLQREGPRHVTPRRRLLDIGGGFGDFSKALAQRFPDDRVTVLEPSFAESARGAHTGVTNAEVIKQSIEGYQPDEPVDEAYLIYSWYWFPEELLDAIYAKIQSVIRPGGILWLAGHEDGDGPFARRWKQTLAILERLGFQVELQTMSSQELAQAEQAGTVPPISASLIYRAFFDMPLDGSDRAHSSIRTKWTQDRVVIARAIAPRTSLLPIAGGFGEDERLGTGSDPDAPVAGASGTGPQDADAAPEPERALVDDRAATLEEWARVWRSLDAYPGLPLEGPYLGWLFDALNQLPSHPAGLRLIDVGGGRGRLAQTIQQVLETTSGAPVRMLLVDGAEVSPFPVMRHASVWGVAEALPAGEARFDLGVMSLVMAYLTPPEREAAARELLRVLVPGGRAIFFFHHPYSDHSRAMGSEGMDRRFPAYSARYNALTEAQIRTLLEAAGFTILKLDNLRHSTITNNVNELTAVLAQKPPQPPTVVEAGQGPSGLQAGSTVMHVIHGPGRILQLDGPRGILEIDYLSMSHPLRVRPAARQLTQLAPLNEAGYRAFKRHRGTLETLAGLLRPVHREVPLETRGDPALFLRLIEERNRTNPEEQPAWHARWQREVAPLLQRLAAWGISEEQALRAVFGLLSSAWAIDNIESMRQADIDSTAGGHSGSPATDIPPIAGGSVETERGSELTIAGMIRGLRDLVEPSSEAARAQQLRALLAWELDDAAAVEHALRALWTDEFAVATYGFEDNRGYEDQVAWVAARAGFSPQAAEEVARAAGALLENLNAHDAYGVVIVRRLAGRRGVELISSDIGPGLAAFEEAIKKHGLEGDRRLTGLAYVAQVMDALEQLPPEVGTVLRARKLLPVAGGSGTHPDDHALEQFLERYRQYRYVSHQRWGVGRMPRGTEPRKGRVEVEFAGGVRSVKAGDLATVTRREYESRLGESGRTDDDDTVGSGPPIAGGSGMYPGGDRNFINRFMAGRAWRERIGDVLAYPLILVMALGMSIWQPLSAAWKALQKVRTEPGGLPQWMVSQGSAIMGRSLHQPEVDRAVADPRFTMFIRRRGLRNTLPAKRLAKFVTQLQQKQMLGQHPLTPTYLRDIYLALPAVLPGGSPKQDFFAMRSPDIAQLKRPMAVGLLAALAMQVVAIGSGVALIASGIDLGAQDPPSALPRLLVPLAAIAAAVGEEYLFRQGLFGWLARRMPSGAANFVQATVFGFAHMVFLVTPAAVAFWSLAFITPLTALPTLISIGLILGWVYQREGLKAAIAAHVTFNLLGSAAGVHGLVWLSSVVSVIAMDSWLWRRLRRDGAQRRARTIAGGSGEIEASPTILEDEEAMNERAARIVKETIEQARREGRGAVLLLPTGETPKRLYARLVEMAHANVIDFRGVTILLLDEVKGTRRYWEYIREHFFTRLPADNRPTLEMFVERKHDDARSTIQRYRLALDRVDAIDLAVLGLGTDGHVAFIDQVHPMAAWLLKARQGRAPPSWLRRFFKDFRPGQRPLSPAMIAANHLEGQDHPQGYTVDLATILSARKQLLLVSGKRKADIVRRLLATTPIDKRKLPASLLLAAPNLTVLLDQEAASRLRRSGSSGEQGRVTADLALFVGLVGMAFALEGLLWVLGGWIIAALGLPLLALIVVAYRLDVLPRRARLKTAWQRARQERSVSKPVSDATRASDAANDETLMNEAERWAGEAANPHLTRPQARAALIRATAMADLFLSDPRAPDDDLPPIAGGSGTDPQGEDRLMLGDQPDTHALSLRLLRALAAGQTPRQIEEGQGLPRGIVARYWKQILAPILGYQWPQWRRGVLEAVDNLQIDLGETDVTRGWRSAAPTRPAATPRGRAKAPRRAQRRAMVKPRPKDTLYQAVQAMRQVGVADASQVVTIAALARGSGLDRRTVQRHLPSVNARLAGEGQPSVVPATRTAHRWTWQDVAQHVVEGATNRQIADALGVSVSNVENHVTALNARLEISGTNRWQLVRTLIRRRMINADTSAVQRLLRALSLVQQDLSPRERRVFMLLIQGLDEAAIERRMPTLRGHRATLDARILQSMTNRLRRYLLVDDLKTRALSQRRLREWLRTVPSANQRLLRALASDQPEAAIRETLSVSQHAIELARRHLIRGLSQDQRLPTIRMAVLLTEPQSSTPSPPPIAGGSGEDDPSVAVEPAKALEQFYQEHGIRGRTAADGTEYEPTPFTALERIFGELRERVGDLTGKTLLDFGTGDLRAALYAANVHYMKVLAVEKDPAISAEAAKIFQDAAQAGLTEGVTFLNETDALDVPWQDVDIVLFYYTDPMGTEAIPFPLEAAETFRARLQAKLREAKPKALLVLLLHPGKIVAGHHIFPALTALEPELVPVSPVGGLRLQLYQVSQELSDQPTAAGQRDDDSEQRTVPGFEPPEGPPGPGHFDLGPVAPFLFMLGLPGLWVIPGLAEYLNQFIHSPPLFALGSWLEALGNGLFLEPITRLFSHLAPLTSHLTSVFISIGKVLLLIGASLGALAFALGFSTIPQPARARGGSRQPQEPGGEGPNGRPRPEGGNSGRSGQGGRARGPRAETPFGWLPFMPFHPRSSRRVLTALSTRARQVASWWSDIVATRSEYQWLRRLLRSPPGTRP